MFYFLKYTLLLNGNDWVLTIQTGRTVQTSGRWRRCYLLFVEVTAWLLLFFVLSPVRPRAGDLCARVVRGFKSIGGLAARNGNAPHFWK